jgi:transcriptional regulator with XRE-family HTH domain
VARDWGRRLRSARLRRGGSQRASATAAGTSQAAWSRLERGRGATAPLKTWVQVSEVVGLDLFPPEARDLPHDASIRRLLEFGGWDRGERIGDARCYDREPRRHPALRALLPAERVVIRAVPVLVDERQEWVALRDAIELVRSESSADRTVAGILMIVATSANRRMARDLQHRSDGRWLRALRDPGVAMPTWPGVVWLAPRGTHLLPGA